MQRLQHNNRELARGISEQIRQYKKAKKIDKERQTRDLQTASSNLETLFNNFNRGKTHFATIEDVATQKEDTLELTEYQVDRNRQEFIKMFSLHREQQRGNKQPQLLEQNPPFTKDNRVYSSTMSFGVQIG